PPPNLGNGADAGDTQDGQGGDNTAGDTQDDQGGDDAAGDTQDDQDGDDAAGDTQDDQGGDDAAGDTQDDQGGDDAAGDTQDDQGGDDAANNTGNGENLQPFTVAVGGVTAPAVTNVGGDRPFKVADNANFPNVELAITRSCDVFFNKVGFCQNVFNSQPNGGGALKQGDCQAAADNCRKGENSAGPAGDGQANGPADNGTSDNGTSDNGLADNSLADNDLADNGLAVNGLAVNGTADNGNANGENLQPFTVEVGGVTAPAVTNVGGDRPFQVAGNANFPNVELAITRSCDVFFNKVGS
ncbi:MAG: hypothetical protein BJ554DRAFT_4989, partial [Olpidium bornovanus]